MTKKQKAAITAAVLAILTALGSAASSLSTTSDHEPRIRVLEAQRVDIKERLDRIEAKIDRLLEQK